MGLVALTENLILLQFEFCIYYDAEDGGKVLLKRNDVEVVVSLGKNYTKPKDYIQIGIDAEDYYRIKDSERWKQIDE